MRNFYYINQGLGPYDQLNPSIYCSARAKQGKWEVMFCVFLVSMCTNTQLTRGPSSSCQYGNWIYNYLRKQCLSPPTFRVRIPPRRGVLDTTLCYKICQWLAACRWFSPDTPVSSTNESDLHDIIESGVKYHKTNHNYYHLHKYICWAIQTHT